MPDQTPVGELKNIGPMIARRLQQVGIKTKSDLKKNGAATAYLKIQAHNPHQTIPVCYYLYSLEGALKNTHWNDLSQSKKERLLKQIH